MLDHSGQGQDSTNPPAFSGANAGKPNNTFSIAAAARRRQRFPALTGVVSLRSVPGLASERYPISQSSLAEDGVGADLPVEAICAEPRNHIHIKVCGAAGLVKLGHAERIRRGSVPA